MRNLNLFLLLPAFLLLAACSDDATEQESVAQKTIFAGMDGNAKSGRTSFVEGEGEKMLGVYWTPGDQIGVFPLSGDEQNVVFNTTISDKAAFAPFKGAMTGTPAYAYYPYAAENTDVHALKGELPSVQDYSTADKKLTYDYKYGLPRTNVPDEFIFTHFFPMIRFVVDATGSVVKDEKLKSVALTFPAHVNFHSGRFVADGISGKVTWEAEATTHEVVMNWTDQPVLAENKKIYGYLFMDVASGLMDKMLKVTLTTDKQVKTFSSKLLFDEFKANFIYNVPLSLKGWQDQFNPDPNEGGLHFGGEADGSEILSVKPVIE